MPSHRSVLPPSALFALLAFAAPITAQTKAPAIPPIDLMPLKEAMAPLTGSGLLETRSAFKVTGSRGGAGFTYRQNAHILARSPSRFRVELSPVGADGTLGPKMLVVSDGLRVWTYWPGQQTYCVLSRKAFDEANVTTLCLAVGDISMGYGRRYFRGFSSVTKENSTAALATIAAAGITLTSKPQSMGGVNYLVYRMSLDLQGQSYVLWVNSKTNTLRQVNLTSDSNRLHLAFEETLTSITVPASVPPDTFTWSPPPGAKKSAATTVDPIAGYLLGLTYN